MKLKFIVALKLSLLLLLSACASGPTIVANTNPGTDLTAFKTFNFIEPLGTDRANGVRSPLSNRLMMTMEQELKQRGLTKSDSPDLLVDFVVSTADRVDVRSTPHHSVHRSHWNRGFNTWPAYTTRVRQYTEGSLLIDLIDPNQNRLVAEGAATSRISSADFTREQVEDVVSQVMTSIWPN